MVTKAPPKWAQELTLNALIYLESKGFNLPVPLLDWRTKRRADSSGECWHKQSRIRINAGRDRTDCKLVLLHEIAHLQGEGHTPAFWALAWDLFRWAKLPIRYCKEREGNYMKGALVAYHKSLRRRNEFNTSDTGQKRQAL